MKRYVLHPGEVFSKTDHQLHFVDAPRLAELYKVDMRECLVAGPGVRLEGAVHLYPDQGGTYANPMSLNGRRVAREIR